MAIEWTNNSTDNLNRWVQNASASWTVTDDGDISTGTIPDWIKTGDHDAKPQFYFANSRERVMMIEAGQDSPGDVFRGSGGVSYDTTTNVLTLSETLSMELNNWTIQVTQKSDSGVFRWPGWGGMTDAWADPGCHAWDVNVGDQTHLIVRTFELSGTDGLTAQSELDAGQSGVWRVSYSIDGASEVITRDVTLPDDESTNFDVALAPQPPVPGARAHFSGAMMGPAGGFMLTQIFVDDDYSEFVGIGDHPKNTESFPQAIAVTFDTIAIDAGVRCVIYSEQNFGGEVLMDQTGPVLLMNSIFKNMEGGSWSWYWEDGVEDPQQPGVLLETIFPPEVRLYSESDMHAWSNGSMKLRQV